jgi:hypothetical protein
MMKTNWLSRSLITGPYVALVLSQKECDQAFFDCGLPQNDWGPWIKTAHADATVHYFDHRDGGLACVVAIRPKDGVTGIQIASLLVHEAVHIWQQFRAHIGEGSPSSEFEAYSIQSIAQELMVAYADRTAS